MTVLDADPVDTRRIRRRKIFAILAGLTVFGIGATVTLAAWTDDEYAQGTFTSGTFGIEGSATPAVLTSFADHPVGGPAVLTFTNAAIIATNLTPGDTVYGLFGIRTIAGSTRSGSLAMTGSVVTAGTATGFTQTIVQSATPACNATVVAAPAATFVTNQPLTTVGNPTTAPTLAQGAAGAAGAAVYLCVAVTATGGAGGIVQGQTVTVRWQFTGTST